MGLPRWVQPATWNLCRFCILLLVGCSGDVNSSSGSGSEPQNTTPVTQSSGSDPVTPTSVPRRSNTTIKIMPLGDSITQSITPLNSYRYYLWHLLLNQEYHVDFVGSRNGVG